MGLFFVLNSRKSLDSYKKNVFSTNLRAINVYKKCGFKEEGVLRESIYLNGNFIDVILMSVLKNEYIDNQNQL